MSTSRKQLVDEIINSDSTKIVDIDDTTVDFTPKFVNFLNDIYGINLDASDIVDYDYSHITPLREIGVTSEDILDDLRYFGNTKEFVNIPLLDGFIDFYKLITNDFSELKKIYFVTSRSIEFYDKPREKTIETLKNNDVPFLEKNLVLTNRKHDFAKSINAKYVFDDSLHVARPFLTNNYSGHIIMNNTAFNRITEKDEILLEEDIRKKKKQLFDLTNDSRVTRMNGWYDLLGNQYRIKT